MPRVGGRPHSSKFSPPAPARTPDSAFKFARAAHTASSCTRLSAARAATFCLKDGRRFEGAYADGYPTAGTYTDERGARFAVEMMAATNFSEVATRGDGVFRSKTPLQVAALKALSAQR